MSTENQPGNDERELRRQDQRYRDQHSSRSEPAVEPERIRAADLDPEQRVPEDAYDRFRQLMLQAVEKLGGKFGREATEILLLVPDLLLLFAGLARDQRVGQRHKLFAGAVVAYLLSPFDLLPEALVGPLGMADDVVVAFLALDCLLNQLPRDILLSHWRGERDLLEVAKLGTALGCRLVPRPLYDRIVRWLSDAGG